MSDNAQVEQFKKMTETPVGKLIISLSIPTIISMLITSIYNMADTYFVGTIGTSATGAAGIVFSLMAVLQAFGFMFGHGAGSNIARQLGSGNVKSAREYASTSFYSSLLAGTVILVLGMLCMDPMMRLMGSTETILPYARIYAFYILIAGPAMTSSCVMNNIMRYEGKAFYAMIGLTSGGILNIFGDYLFVQVFQMGIAGAGLSTAISQYVSMIILLIPFIRGKTQSSFSVRYITRSFQVFKNIVTTGMPSLARQGLNSISVMILNNYAGIYGDVAVAGISIVTKIINFLFCFALGVGQGFQPVCAFNYGAKKFSRVKKGFYFSLKVGSIMMIFFAALAFFNAGTFISFFRDDLDVIAIGTVALRFQCISLMLMPVSMYGNMLFQSIGKAGTATFLAALRSGITLIPCVILLNLFFGLTGIEMAQATAEILSALITLPFELIFLRSLPQDGYQF